LFSLSFSPAARLKGSQRWRHPHSSLRRFAATMHWLGSGAHYHVIGALFGMSAEAVHKHVHFVVSVLRQQLVSKHIAFPQGQELDQVMEDFSYYGLPQCAGAIDGCFIEMKQPTGTWGNAYWCYKQITAILLLAVVDARGRFTYINADSPASVGDAGTFNKSKLCELLQQGGLLPMSQSKQINGVQVRPYLVGDAAFPLSSFLLKTYDGEHARRSRESCFNHVHIRCRRHVESAFGRLKGRWRVLVSRNFRDPDWVGEIVEVCCALHNICEKRELFFDDEWRIPVDHGDSRAVHPSDEGGRTGGIAVRDALAEHVRAQQSRLASV